MKDAPQSASRRGIRFIVAGLCMLVVSGAAVVTFAAPASAACSGGPRIVITEPVAATAHNRQRCGATWAITNGTVSDNNCDNRSARVQFRIDYRIDKLWFVQTTSPVYLSSTGCGGSSTFNNVTLTASGCSTCEYRFRTRLFACSATCSDNYWSDVHYFL
jgi:hypothetical protein